MGYSARYHATSLMAVFLALAIGILIGAEFGGDTLSNTRKNLEHSLAGNLQDARERADGLNQELGRANEFSSRVYPALVRDQLRGRRIGLLAFGDLPSDVYGAIGDALAPTGAHLVGVGVVREPGSLGGGGGGLGARRVGEVFPPAGRGGRLGGEGKRAPPVAGSAGPSRMAGLGLRGGMGGALVVVPAGIRGLLDAGLAREN